MKLETWVKEWLKRRGILSKDVDEVFECIACGNAFQYVDWEYNSDNSHGTYLATLQLYALPIVKRWVERHYPESFLLATLG